MYAVCDVETTGRTPFRNEVITLDFIIADENLEKIDERGFKFRPVEKHVWSEEASAVHGFSWHSCQLFPDKRESFNDMQVFLKHFGSGLNFICHALPVRSRIDLFDYQFLLAMYWEEGCRSDFYRIFPEKKVESTISKQRKAACERWGIKNQRLDTWCEKLGIDSGRHHDSAFDTYVALEIYKYQKGIHNGLGKGC